MAGFFFVHGTWGGLVLRVAQCAFAFASIFTLLRALDHIPDYTLSVDRFLITTIGLDALWGFVQGVIHLICVLMKEGFENTGITWLFIIMDVMITFTSLAAAASSTYITLLFLWDTELCRAAQLPCGQFLLAVSFAYIAWFLQATSAGALFCQHVHLVTREQHRQ